MLATLVFGMPPVIRLTALGIRGVPESTKEAATAFGCTRWTLLKDIEVPLAMPSIMTGVNQTILMCLSMVIASLIGAKGLGQDVLVALQYAAKGQGCWRASRSCSARWSSTASCRDTTSARPRATGPGGSVPGGYPRKPSATRLTISNMIAAAVCAVIRLG